MQELVDDVKQQIADQAAAHPEFQGKTAAVVTPYEGMFVYGPEDPRSRMLVDLGFDLPQRDLRRRHGASSASRSAPSAPPTSTRSASRSGSTSRRTRREEGLRADHHGAREGRWFDIAPADGGYYVAHSFVTPLSIPYVLERYVPQLAAAADGDPSTVPPEAAA